MTELETIAMQVIIAGGNARSEAFQALRMAKQGNFAAAEEHLKASRVELSKAHDIQTELIQNEADGRPIGLSLLMVHAQDHYMTAMSEQTLVTEMVELYRRLAAANN
ncbi:MAG TPA: PTS lactose/cellobiose transporter subunit IIA [Symbiobacteriaceae bacterium]|nr:PTS lactose/cellobiose transporter subunit IIA [Symbiobacteriaceae bacterium]